MAASPLLYDAVNYSSDIDDSADVENKHVIVVNSPGLFPAAYAPFYKAYHGQPLPRSLRTLSPGCTSLDVRRTDDRTLVLQSRGPNLFSCDDLGLLHAGYALQTLNVHIFEPHCRKGDKYNLGILTVEVLELDLSGLPSRVAFRFDMSLDSPDFHWLRFDWPTLSYQPLKIPDVGHSITVFGLARRYGA